MKKIIFFLFLTTIIGGLSAQPVEDAPSNEATKSKPNVGVGTATPDASTMLHVEDNNRGILIPKVALQNVSIFGLEGNSQTEGILVYNTFEGIIGGYGKGFYFWNGTQWDKLVTASGK